MRIATMKIFKKTVTTSCLVVIGLSLAGCELLGPKPVAKLPLTPVPRAKPDVVFQELQNKPSLAESAAPASELYPGTDRFVANSAPQHRRAAAPKGEGSYSLNFDEADLGEVAKVVLSDILGQNYVLSPKVTGKVTLQTTEPLTREELLPTLEMVLRMNNAALVKDGRIYHIEPAGEALYTSGVTGGRSGYQTRVIPVRNVAVQEIADIIKPLVHEKTILGTDDSRNILVASGTADEIARVMDLVGTFDIDVLKGRSFGLFPLAHVEPDTIIEELESIFRQKGKADEKSGESAFFQFIPIERLNAILAVTHQARYLNDIESWVLRLDRANTTTGGGVNVYKAQHVDAEELAETLNEIFTSTQKKEKTAKVAPGKTASEISNKPMADKPMSKKSPAGNQPTGNAGVSNVDDVRIIADKANNAVVIVATPREYETILPVIKQLDILPLQVLIDATVVSVNLTNDLQYGISWYLSHGNDSIGGNKAGATALGTAAAAAAAASTGGLSTVFSSGSVKALLNAQASKGNVNVISSPSLMVLNNQQAKINVGDQVPLQTSTTSLPIAGGTTPSIAQSASIQYKDTGVTLEVTPRVNANGMVIMEIKQIVSNVKEVPVNTTTSIGVTSTATITKKEIESSVAVQDGETIVLGGLIDDNNNATKSGIPFLYELPWIGSLFGSTEYKRAKNELVVLITPRVVKSKQDSRLISDEFKRKLTGIYQEVTPVSYISTTPARGRK